MGLPTDPHRTDRPSHFARQAYHELGFADPDAAVSKPAPVQAWVLSEAVKARYGLAGINVGAGAHPRETIDQLADAHQNLRWMAHVLGLPETALGLDGKLRLWLGRRDAPEVTVGGTPALGVYRPGNRTIYMPGRSNSFAHEWTHALDHALGDRLANAPNRDALLSLSPGDWAQASPSMNTNTNTTPGAFARVMGAMFGRDSGAALHLMQIEARAAASPPSPAMAKALADARRAFEATDFLRGAQARGRGYLDQPYEMLARAHEAYIGHQIEAAGGSTEFVAKGDRSYLSEADQHMRAAYPKGDERAAIFKAWGDLHAQLRHDALYPAGAAAAKRPQNDLGGLGPTHWGQLGIAPGPDTRSAAGVVARTVNKASLATQMLQRVGIDRRAGADPGYLTARVRAMDSLRALTFSPRGQMQAIIARTPEAARRHAQGLLDAVTTDPGSGRHVARTFEEAVHQDTRRDVNAYAALVRRGDLFDLSAREVDQLHAMLTQREDVSRLPERIQKAIRDNTLSRLSDADKAVLDKAMLASSDPSTPTAVRHLASGIRALLDAKHYELRQAGLDVPYIDGYFPRWYDDHKIYAESAAFERDATRVLAIRFAREVENDPEELRSRFAQVKGALAPTDVSAIDAAMAASRAHAAGAPIETAEGLLPDPAQRDTIGRAWAAQGAAHWVERIRTGYPTEYDTRGPRGQALRARLNPAEADAILRKWLVTDPHAVIPAYMGQVNRKIAYVQRFGLAGEKIDQALAAADKAGMRPEDQTAFRAHLESITGRTVRSPEGSAVARALNWIDAAGTIVLMSRVVFSALAEPMAVLPRTGSVRATYEAFAQSVRDVARTGEAKRIAEVANALGMTADGHYESVLTNRVGGPYADSVILNTALTNYFRRVGLTGLTNSQRRGALVAAHIHLRSLAGDLLSGDKGGRRYTDAQAGLRELGVGDPDHADFARWISKFERPPNVADLESTQGGALYRGAVNRFTDQVNQEPKASERPALAAHPIGRMAFSLMSFQYALFANVVERFIKNTERQMHDARGFGGKSRVLANSIILGAASVAAMFAANFILAAARNALFSGDAWDKHAEEGNLGEWLSASAMSATGLGGPLDAVGQAATAIRYRRELTSLTAGAKLGFFLQATEEVIRPFVADKPSSVNTADFNAAAAAYRLAVMPVLATALTALPGGPLTSGLAGAGIAYGTSRSASDRFAGAIFGPKGTGARDAEHEHEDEDQGEAENPLDRPPSKASSFDGGANPLYGLADDVAPAATRILRGVPVIGKVALGVGAAGYAASKIAEEADRFSGGAPPRERR